MGPIGDSDAVGATTDELLESVVGDLEKHRRWLKLTFDQLRTLVVVRQAETVAEAGRRLGRQQSSVQKQLDTLNEYFRSTCGEALVLQAPGRGEPIVFTPTGEAVSAWARETLHDWHEGVTDRRRANDETVTIATTAFAIDVLGEFWPRIEEYARANDIEVFPRSVGTRDFLSALDDRTVDLVLGGRAKPRGEPLVDEEAYRYITLERHEVMLLTTQPELMRKGVQLTRKKLEDRSIRFILPRGGAGLIPDLLTQWLGDSYEDKITVVAEIPDIHYGLALLHYDIVDGGTMVVLGTIKDRIDSGALRRPKGSQFVPVADELARVVESVGGLFARREVLESRPDDHPINHIWREFKAFAEDRRATGGAG